MDLEKELAELRTQLEAIRRPSSTRPDVIPVQHPHTSTDHIQTNLSREYRFPEIPDWLEKDLTDMLLGVSKDDFKDNEWADRPAVRLESLTHQQICKLGKVVLPALQNGLSIQGVAAIFVLAFNLRAPGSGNTEKVFGDADPFQKLSDRSYTSLEDAQLVSTGDSITAYESGDVVERAKAYSFLAASVLRLFTKTPNNFVKAWGHIQRGYQTFYVKRCPVSGITPNEEVIKILHLLFSNYDLFKATLYRLLWLSNDKQENESIKGFLYDSHLSYTGMHIVPSFCRLRTALSCDTAVLLKAIRTSQYERQLKALCQILQYMSDKQGEHKRQLWKYGRIFDHTFMKVLQTRTCPKLVMILASALQQEEPEGAENILQIRQLEEVTESDKEKCKLAGDALRKMIKNEKSREHHKNTTKPPS